MHLIILTQYYPPEIGAPQRRLSELAERMVQAGYEVTVLTAMPNYPHGKIYEGYGGVFRREERNGVQIIRTAIYPTQKASFLHRLTNYFSFVISSAFLGTFALRRADFLMVESPPLFLGFSALWLNWIKRARLIFNVSDLWPESAVQLGLVRRDSRAHRLSAWLERMCYQRAWLVTGQSHGILGDITGRYPNTHTFRLSNGVDVERFGAAYFDESRRAELSQQSDEKVALYAGLHGLAQGLNQLIEAADQLRDEGGLKIVLVGDGPEKSALQQDAEQRSLTNFAFHDPVPAEAVPAMLAAADILLVTLKAHIPGAVPSKLYEAMASGKPVIVVAEGEPAQIIEQYEAGIAVQPGDIAGLVAALRTLRDQATLRQQYAKNGRKAVEMHFNREKIVAAFMQHLEANA